MNEWTVQSIKGFIAEHKNSGSSYYETKAKDIECLLNEYNGLIDRVLEIIEKAQTYKMAVGSTDLFIDREAFRDEVLALKGGEQE